MLSAHVAGEERGRLYKHRWTVLRERLGAPGPAEFISRTVTLGTCHWPRWWRPLQDTPAEAPPQPRCPCSRLNRTLGWQGVSPSRLHSVPSLSQLNKVALKSTRHRLFQKIQLFIVLDANTVFELLCSVEHGGGDAPDRGARGPGPGALRCRGSSPLRFSDRDAHCLLKGP